MKFFTPLIALLFTYLPNHFLINGIVNKVFDGDTIELKRINGDLEKIRLVYIDAAEMEQGPWGKRARDHIEVLIGKTVEVEVVGRGYYGRKLGEVYFNGESINFDLINSGLVWLYPWSRFQTLRQKNIYLEAEARNKRLRRGVWRKKILAPWKYRKKNRRGV